MVPFPGRSPGSSTTGRSGRHQAASRLDERTPARRPRRPCVARLGNRVDASLARPTSRSCQHCGSRYRSIHCARASSRSKSRRCQRRSSEIAVRGACEWRPRSEHRRRSTFARSERDAVARCDASAAAANRARLAHNRRWRQRRPQEGAGQASSFGGAGSQQSFAQADHNPASG